MELPFWPIKQIVPVNRSRITRQKAGSTKAGGPEVFTTSNSSDQAAASVPFLFTSINVVLPIPLEIRNRGLFTYLT